MALGWQRRIEAKEVALTSAGSWVGTLLFFAITAGLFLFALFAIRDFVAILITGFFAAFGVGGLVMLVRAGSSQRRYGPMPLALEGAAPAPGGRLRASVRLPAAATAAPLRLRATLVCSRVMYGEKQSRSEEPLRGLHQDLEVARSPAGAQARFEFELPADLPHADDPGQAAAAPNKTYARWELKLVALGEGADLSRSYDIPVVRAQTREALPPAAAPSQADGPMEIVRPLARPVAAPAAAATDLDPRAAALLAAAAAARAREPEAPGLVPEDDNKSLWVLVACNLIPLAGVIFWGWRVHEVVFLYWIENLVIGAVNVLRMRIAVPDTLPSLARRGVEVRESELFWGKLAVIGFFIVHYGIFCLVHGTFLASFFPPGQGGGRELGDVLRHMLLNPATLVAIIGIVLSHAYSYFHNYLGRGEYLQVDMRKMMFRPYKRIAVTHLFIFAGAFTLRGMGSPVAAMLAFIALKVLIDGHAHRRERGALAGAG
ncbi:MAG: hypothetical protein IT513_05215 [Burkholderiales bacterium]|nr:hypothetical protein [Burkholderiales bacterium]